MRHLYEWKFLIGDVGKTKDPYIFSLVSLCPPPLQAPFRGQSLKPILRQKIGMFWCHSNPKTKTLQ